MPKRRGHGEGSIYRRQDGRWTAELYLGVDDTGKKKVWRAYGKTRRDVAEKLGTAITEHQRGRLVISARTTLAAYLREWLPIVTATLKPSTAGEYGAIVERILIPALGRTPLVKLTTFAIQQMIGKLSARYQPGSVRNVCGVLHKALNDAIDMEIIGYNPATRTKRPRNPRREFPPWTLGQVQQLSAALHDDRDEVLILLTLYSGARAGEMLALSWDDVDWADSAIMIRHAVQRVRGAGRSIAEPKTASGIRPVALPAEAMAALRRQQTRVRELRLRAGPAWADRNLVFPGARGQLRTASRTRRLLHTLTAKLGLPPLSLRALRHLSASLLLKEGVHPKIVQQRLGHANVQITMDVYSHVLPGLDRDAAERLGRLF